MFSYIFSIEPLPREWNGLERRGWPAPRTPVVHILWVPIYLSTPRTKLEKCFEFGLQERLPESSSALANLDHSAPVPAELELEIVGSTSYVNESRSLARAVSCPVGAHRWDPRGIAALLLWRVPLSNYAFFVFSFPVLSLTPIVIKCMCQSFHLVMNDEIISSMSSSSRQ